MDSIGGPAMSVLLRTSSRGLRALDRASVIAILGARHWIRCRKNTAIRQHLAPIEKSLQPVQLDRANAREARPVEGFLPSWGTRISAVTIHIRERPALAPSHRPARRAHARQHAPSRDRLRLVEEHVKPRLLAPCSGSRLIHRTLREEAGRLGAARRRDRHVGDSWVDGDGSTPDVDPRRTDALAARLARAGGACGHVAVLNEAGGTHRALVEIGARADGDLRTQPAGARHAERTSVFGTRPVGTALALSCIQAMHSSPACT